MKKRGGLSFKRSKFVKIGQCSAAKTSQDLLKRFIVGQYMLDIFEFFEVIFIDECYFHSDTTFYSWGEKGRPLIITGPSRGQFKIGVCAAISKKKFLGYQLLNGVSADKFMFRDFLEGLFSQIIPQHHRRKIVVFLDNSSVHRSKLIEEYCQKYDIKMIFNAPYCPDFNPIENLFSLWKNKVHNKVLNTRREAIEEIVRTSIQISNDKKDYISSFVLRSLYHWKVYSDCQITDSLDLNLAQELITTKKTQRKQRKQKK